MNDRAEKSWVVIPAAGIGSRMGEGKPKQYRELCGQPMLTATLQPFLACDFISGIKLVVASEEELAAMLDTLDDSRISVCEGGATRADSVLAGLNALADADERDWVLVHDAARPCITATQLLHFYETLKHDAVGGIWAIPLTDTIKKANSSGVSATIDRTSLWRAQTPQMFRLGALKAALKQAKRDGVEVTDESSSMEHFGHTPKIVEGMAHNIKVTYPEDFALAEYYLKHVLGDAE